ncbi:hypothetical protein CPB83DRAFT_576834 [Crepidotus variabilis]|uniref:Nephrocystin 3-like N-terminal domain-containing protein n=1 Tax=Crepidotus variabilis TaxID=179855 RepID=A0A9P6JL40_9AGAR|nr:hypothetical protein CPB83DRAFT_576834 [Crepidotus variabilis]
MNLRSRAFESTAFFSRASNFQLHGTNIFSGGDVLNNQENVPNYTNPVRLILFHCALDALVDSNRRYDPPRCEPQTRDEIIQEIIDWVNNDTSPPIMWLRGSAGCGKSAICQTIAELFGQKKTLIASFFFSRAAGSSSSSNGDCLIPTIIFQLRQSLPETRPFIDAEIRKNPIIFTRARGVQMASLFVHPLQQRSILRFFKNLLGQKVRLIVLDGWDECQDPEVQCDLLRILADAVSTLSRKVRILIASRPEAHITHVFETYPTFQRLNMRQINLDEDHGASQDILHFIRDKIRQIRETHPLRNYLNPSWPSDAAVNFLVSKASPQFILASTVMTYISDLEDRPDARLDAIINALSGSQEPAIDNPFENLDKVYRFIFTQVKARYRQYVWCILGGIHGNIGHKLPFPIPCPNFFEIFFKLRPGEVNLMLNPLLSLLSIPKDPVLLQSATNGQSRVVD